ncbi:MAG TPA: sarcosine oxidase subunit gamma family protein [Stellaceae bacterium]|jgi:sarcosine oxidase subunit gamma|nr:sarcosine oxidase subunit gamma family protein [Stellaceae bacterium]
MVERVSALAAIYQPGRVGTIGPMGPGIILAERRPLVTVQVAARGEEGRVVRDALAAVLGIAPDGVTNRAVTKGTTSILWVGPERWLVVESERGESDLDALLRAALGGTSAAVTDLGNGRTTLRIAGPRSRDLLAKGSAIDFHPRVFPVGACAQGLLGHVGVLFHAVDETPCYDLYVARSYAQTVWEWLIESAADYGCQIESARN